MSKISVTLLTMALFMITGPNIVKAQRVTVTIAGTGVSSGFTGDGGSGRHALLNGPQDVCTDAALNVYFTDEGNGRIRKISSKNGVISTVAGGGTSTSDGIPAINALLTPKNICIDAAGNLFVVNNSTNQIKRIDAVSNIITTVAGNGTAGYTGDGGAAVSATFNGILGICTDGTGNLYVVDSGNNCIRKVTAGTGIVTTIAGTGVAGLSGDGGPAIAATLNSPTAVTVNPAGDVFFIDQSGVVFESQLRKISAMTGIITTVAGTNSSTSIFGVPLLNTWLADVTGLCMDADGNFYCNEISCSCRKMNMSTDSTYAVGGNFSIESFSDDLNSNSSWMDYPYGICVDAAQDLYIADKYNSRIRKLIQLTHTPTFAFGKGQSINVCTTASVDSQLIITDLDSLQTETWTVLSTPVHGSLSGFPVTASSMGTYGITIPSGTAYTAASGYTGLDSFKVQVSDGSLSDIVTIYVTNLGGGGSSITGPNSVCTEVPVAYTDGTSGGTWDILDPTVADISTAGMVTGLTAGTATITYTVNLSCGLVSFYKTITVDATPPVSAGTITGPATICPGAVIIFADGIAGGAWSLSNTTDASVSATGVVMGIYPGPETLTYTVSNACGSVDAVSSIIVNTLPAAGTITGETTLCKGATITLSDPTSVGTGTWSASNGNSTVSPAGVVTGVAAGANIIYYTVTNSCGTVVASLPVTITHCSNVGVPLVSVPVPNIYPNPASSVLNIVWDALQSGTASLSMADVTGRVVLRSELTATSSSTATVNVSSLKEGIYLVTINNDTEHYTYKIVVGK